MLTTRDLSQGQEAGMAAIVFGYCLLFVLARLEGAAAIASAVLAFLLPIAVIELARSMATTEAEVIARRGIPEPVQHQTLGLGAPSLRRLGGGPQRITTAIAMSLGSAGVQFAAHVFPARRHDLGPVPLLFMLWTVSAALFIYFAVPRQINPRP